MSYTIIRKGGLPNVFLLCTVVDDGGHDFEVVEEELGVELLEGGLEAEVVGLVGIHLENADDAADTCRATAALADGRIALAVGDAEVVGAFEVAVVTQVLVVFGVDLVILYVGLPGYFDVGGADLLAHVVGQACGCHAEGVAAEVHLCHTAHGVEGRTHTDLVGTGLGHGREAQGEVEEAADEELVALVVVPATATLVHEVAEVGVGALVDDVLDIAFLEEGVLAAAVAVGQQFGEHGDHIDAEALLCEEVLRGFVEDEHVVDGVVEAVLGVVVVVAVVRADEFAACDEARFVVVARAFVVVGGDAVDEDGVFKHVDGGIFALVADLRNLDEAAVRTHGGVVVPDVGGHVDQLRVLDGRAPLVVELVAVVYELVVGHLTLDEVVGDELVDSVVGVFQVVGGCRAVDALAVGHEDSENIVPVGNLTLFVGAHADAQFVVIDGVGLGEDGVAVVARGVAVDDGVLFRCQTVGGDVAPVLSLVVVVAILGERVGPRGFHEQASEDLHVVGGSQTCGDVVGRGGDDGIDLVDHTVRYLVVKLGDEGRAVDDVGETGGVLRAGEHAVVEVGEGEGARRGEVGAFVGRFAAVVDDAVEGDELCLLVGKVFQRGHAQFVEELVHCRVVRGEDGIVAACAQHGRERRGVFGAAQTDAVVDGFDFGELRIGGKEVESGLFALDGKVAFVDGFGAGGNPEGHHQCHGTMLGKA